MGRIILASSSPRRQELIRRVWPGEVKNVTPRVKEEYMPGTPPEELVLYWSRKKAESAAEFADPGDILIAGDTIVWYEGNALGKPADKTDAFNMLAMLSGNWHTVYTGLTVIYGDELVSGVEETAVLMRQMTAGEIEAYVETGEPMDKAGAYGIQERGAFLCERVEGDFYNVVGLPLFRLGRILSSMGVDLFEILE